MTYDYIIVGSGIAGLYTALLAREHGSVLILTKGSIDECNTKLAQGGIAAAIGRDDSPDLHFQDTIAAGADLCRPEAVRILTEEAPARITDLIRFGVPFDTIHGEVALTREAAHSVNRILHAGGDATGEHIELTLAALAQHRNIGSLSTPRPPGSSPAPRAPAGSRRSIPVATRCTSTRAATSSWPRVGRGGCSPSPPTPR